MLVPEKRLRPYQASPEDRGCIGCHFGYFASGYSVARQLSCVSIACGFVAYQNSWVEQTPYAVERLRALMLEYGITLLLPVAELRSKAEVQAELATYGVTQDSLELKCSKQEIDPGLVASSLKATVDQGIEALRFIFLGTSSGFRLQGIHSYIDICRLLFVFEPKPLLKRVACNVDSGGDALRGFTTVAVADEYRQPVGRFEQPSHIRYRSDTMLGLVFGCDHGSTSGL
jgi:hypothetical protein